MIQIVTATLLALALGATAPAAAQEFPSKPVRIVVPWSPGGGADIVARLLSAKLTEVWGKSVYVENKPGATGTVGSDMVAKSAADGHTLLLTNNSTYVMAVGMMKLPYDQAKDLKPISRVAEVPHVLSVNAGVPASSMAELIALAKSKPGQMPYGTSGLGSTPHIAGEMFMAATGTKLLQVPYKGSGQSLPDTASGNVLVSFDTAPSALPFIQSGKLRPLAIMSSRRLDSLPGIATTAELGAPNALGVTWYGLYGPGKLPEAVTLKIHADILRVVQLPDVKARLAAMGGIETASMPPDTFASEVQAEIKRYLPVLQTIKTE